MGWGRPLPSKIKNVVDAPSKNVCPKQFYNYKVQLMFVISYNNVYN